MRNLISDYALTILEMIVGFIAFAILYKVSIAGGQIATLVERTLYLLWEN